jgi:hypothetical protein
VARTARFMSLTVTRFLQSMHLHWGVQEMPACGQEIHQAADKRVRYMKADTC